MAGSLKGLLLGYRGAMLNPPPRELYEGGALVEGVTLLYGIGCPGYCPVLPETGKRFD